MTFKDIQVHVDIDAACGKRLELAVNLASKFNAHLTGVHVRRLFPYPAYGVLSASESVGVFEAYNEVLGDHESTARATFDRVIGQVNPAVSWRATTGSPANELAEDARYCDLLVLGQADHNDEFSLNDGLADKIIMSAGRPCLLVPFRGSPVEFGQSPLIAWDGSREASRAVHDALPLLKLAGKATFIIVEPEKLGTNFGNLPGAAIAEHLARHDITITVEVSRDSKQNTGDTILTYADAYGHDLIVMGAYGHSRLREVVVGGATRTIMKKAEVPVLLSH